MIRKMLSLAIPLLLLASCGREKPGPEPEPEVRQVTIRVTIPEEAGTKVSYVPGVNKLYMYWEEGDRIRISGETSEVFTLSNLLSGQQAEFTGNAVSGSRFNISYPAAEAGASAPVQKGNGSVDHLRYQAFLEGVSSMDDVEFSSSWASAHGGTLRQGEVLKVTAVLPKGPSTLKQLGMAVGEKSYTLTLADVDVSEWDQTLTAYMMLPGEDAPLRDDAQVSLWVTDTDDEVYTQTVAGRQIKGFDKDPVTGFTLRNFAAGDGTAESPYIIATAKELDKMHNNGVLKRGAITYFRLAADIDASGISNWVPLNSGSPFDRGIDFDGASHTITGLKSVSTSYASFAGVLYGNIHDVTFSGASIIASSKCGVVAGFLGTTSNDYARVATCCNVTVIGSTVDGVQAAGGFAGHVRGKGSVTGCKVINTTVSGESHLGGFAGLADISGVDKYEVPAIFTGCEVSGVTVNQNNTDAGTVHTGGFIGYTYQAHSFIDCKVTGTTVSATKSAVNNVGGFIGYTDYAGANFQNCTVDAASQVTAKGNNVGGFVGWANVPDAYKECASAATVVSEGAQTGGFVGYAAGSSMYKDCVATGNVSGKNCTGGFVGAVQNSLMMYCRSIDGSVTATGNTAGGFCGSIGGGSLLHCYTTARLQTGSLPAGGFVGMAGPATLAFCYSAAQMQGGSGAFVGTCVKEGEDAPASISHCIGWSASLPFCGAGEALAEMEEVYAGNEGTVSAQATAQLWPAAVWNLSGALPVLQDGDRRIPAIFVGDSITWQWARNSNTLDKTNYPLKIPFNPAYMTDNGSSVTVRFHPAFFSGNGYVDKGISGQNTTQMKARFQKDVIALSPAVVVIMAGTNDLAQGVTEEGITSNIADMAAMAAEAGIKVVLCSVTPNNDTYSKLSNPKTKGAHIVKLNGLIQALTQSHGYTWCNYWSSMVTDPEEDLSMKMEYRLYDNLHPGPDGYDVMEGIIKPIIDGLLN